MSDEIEKNTGWRERKREFKSGRSNSWINCKNDLGTPTAYTGDAARTLIITIFQSHCANAWTDTKRERSLVDQVAKLHINGSAQGLNSEPIHIEDEVKDHEDEVEDARDKRRVRRECRREIKHTIAWHMDGMTRTNTWANVLLHIIKRARVLWRRKSDTHFIGCSRLLSAENETYSNNFFFFEKMDYSRELHQLLDVSQFHHEELEEEGCHLEYCWKIGSSRSSPDSRWRPVQNWDCGSQIWLKSHRCILARFVQCEIPMFLISQKFLSGKIVVVLLCQLSIWMHISSVQPILSCESRQTGSSGNGSWIPSNSFGYISFVRCGLRNALSVPHCYSAEHHEVARLWRRTARFERASNRHRWKILAGFAFTKRCPQMQ